MLLPLSGGFVVGECVEYHSRSLGEWIPAVILKVRATGSSYDLDCRPRAAWGSIRSLTEGEGLPEHWREARHLSEGADQGRTYYYNAETNAVQWHRPGQPPSSGGPGYEPGEEVEYHSTSQGEWIAAKVLRKHSNGTYDLDCKPQVQPDRIRPREAAPVSAAPVRKSSSSSRSVEEGPRCWEEGQSIEYHSTSRQEWIPASIVKVNPDGTYDLGDDLALLFYNPKP